MRVTLCALLALLTGCATARAPEPVTAFIGVTLIAAYGEAPAQDQTVLVRGDRIIAVGAASDIAVPGRASAVRGEGRYLAPGLADMHVHLFEPSDAVLFLANGVTTVRNMSGRPETTALARRIAAGELPGPTVYSSTPILDGPHDPDFAEPNAIRTADEMRQRVTELAAGDGGFVGVKLYDSLPPEAYQAGVRAAHERGLQAYGHVPLALTVDEVLAMRIDSIEHLIRFERALAPHSVSVSEEEVWTQADMTLLPGLARRVSQSGVWIDATLVIYTDTPRAFADLGVARSTAEYRYATARQRLRWREAYETVDDPRAAWAMTERAHPVRLAVVRALHEAGAPLLIGTDAPQPYVYAGFSLHRELELHREAGLTPSEILRAASADAARFLRREGEFGMIAPGARADLVLLDAHPEQDMATLRSPAGVVAAGRWRDRAELQRLLDEAAERIARAP